VLVEGVDAFGREDDTAFGGARLRRQDYQCVSRRTLQGPPDAHCAALEVEAFPVEAEKFARLDYVRAGVGCAHSIRLIGEMVILNRVNGRLL
jgi:hypothetical protein